MDFNDRSINGNISNERIQWCHSDTSVSLHSSILLLSIHSSMLIVCLPHYLTSINWSNKIVQGTKKIQMKSRFQKCWQQIWICWRLLSVRIVNPTKLALFCINLFLQKYFLLLRIIDIPVSNGSIWLYIRFDRVSTSINNCIYHWKSVIVPLTL